ncbi:RusA family crossover junction endodeoxyribonuclease [Acidisoma cellulosilytica]|uniref:RusA family crossover junction endodeoxyribonuclease n=1 Tax=Acidisoma cellulosilyticum TaxID=2802395 RepID=A0A963YZA7_9PROT|nr:RusA family crossover junction endodeoxyribonuclease [Acidisoma cellulosilyticum]MCB8879913.1 RusA family crossover junction endodeoxyribonuclease [Acidisoma cellulosilyticum]
MTVEIAFPLEFVVDGTPVSLQTKRSAAKDAWKAKIRRASMSALPEGHFCSAGRISVTLFYFPLEDMQGDIDNIVKPVLDAFSQHIYLDDRQVERILIQRFDPEKTFAFREASPILEQAIKAPKPLLYVRLSDDPSEELS